MPNRIDPAARRQPAFDMWSNDIPGYPPERPLPTRPLPAAAYEEPPRARRTVQVERYRKGPVGWFCATLFWLFQAATALWLLVLLGAGALEAMMLSLTLFVWFWGTLPLAVLRYVTRGKRIVVTEVVR